MDGISQWVSAADPAFGGKHGPRALDIRASLTNFVVDK